MERRHRRPKKTSRASVAGAQKERAAASSNEAELAYAREARAAGDPAFALQDAQAGYIPGIGGAISKGASAVGKGTQHLMKGADNAASSASKQAAKVAGRNADELASKVDDAAEALTGKADGVTMKAVDPVKVEIINPDFTPKPTTLGKVGEALSGVKKNTDKISINGRKRIPDGLTDDVLSEVKNVKKLSYTRQLRDFSDFAAKQEGLRFDLYVPKSTAENGLSGPLQDAINSGDINLHVIPGI